MKNKEIVEILTSCAEKEIKRVDRMLNEIEERFYLGECDMEVYWNAEKENIQEAVRCLKIKFGISD